MDDDLFQRILCLQSSVGLFFEATSWWWQVVTTFLFVDILILMLFDGYYVMND